eukprot:6463556-Amphidinium_carterae.1
MLHDLRNGQNDLRTSISSRMDKVESGHEILCARVNSLADELEQLRTRAVADVVLPATAQKLEAVAFPLGSIPADEHKPRPRSMPPPPKSSSTWAARTIAGPTLRSESADARPSARKEVVHLSGFTEPRSHAEFKQWVETNVPGLPSDTQIRTRGEYNIRLSLHFTTAESARSFISEFRAKPLHEVAGGAVLYIQRDLALAQRKIGYVLRGVRKHLVAHSKDWYKPTPGSADDGPLSHIKLGYSSNAIYLNRWR